MSDKKPLSYVENRITKTYPTEVGAPKFEPDNISIFNQQKLTLVKSHFTSKFEELSSKWQDLLDEVHINEMIYSSKYNFIPTVGHSYFLYEGKSENFLSLISPKEWGDRYKFIGEFIFNHDGVWTKKKDSM